MLILIFQSEITGKVNYDFSRLNQGRNKLQCFTMGKRKKIDVAFCLSAVLLVDLVAAKSRVEIGNTVADLRKGVKLVKLNKRMMKQQSCQLSSGITRSTNNRN